MSADLPTQPASVVPGLLAQLMARQNLTREQARAAMEEILSGAATAPQIGAFIVALRMKGEVAEEVIGLAQAVRSRAAPVRPRNHDALVDTCGTGGDASGTFNISTATAFVAAGCGVRIAKHCNRSISSRTGGADVVEGLGININLSPERMAACIDEVGIAFLFAPLLHSAWKYAQPVRRELRVRTVFNMLGPICNPANASMQVAGVYEKRLVRLVAHALAELGLKRGFVVHGSDGLDEITTTGETEIAEVREGKVRLFALCPEEVGLPRCKPEDLLGGDVAQNVRILLEILEGSKGPKRDIVLLNSAAALVAAGKAADFAEGVRQAADSIDTGAARRRLVQLTEFTNQPS